MAGDWIKLQTSTPDKPEVFRMSMELGIPPEHVLGCLIRVWIWADQQTLNGNDVCVTGVTLDRIACTQGIAKAMQSVGWLTQTDGNFCFPNFDRHNGETAKTRASTQKRMQKHRSSTQQDSNDDSLQGTEIVLPEKRREEKSNPIVGESPKRTPPNRGTRFDPAAFDSMKVFEVCKSMRPELDPQATFDSFRDYWISTPGAKGVKLDWMATWRNWVRNQRAGIKKPDTEKRFRI